MLISLDISAMNLGYAVYSPYGELKSVGVLRPSKNKKNKKQKFLKDFIIAKELYAQLHEIVLNKKVAQLIGEMPSGSQGYRAAKLQGIAIAVVASIIDSFNLKYYFCTPYDVKKAICKNRAATKHDMMDAVASLYKLKVKKKQHGKRFNKEYFCCGQWYNMGTFEHIADAIGVFEAY